MKVRWTALALVALLMVLPAASALEITTPIDSSDIEVYQGERMVFYVNTTTNASVVTLYMYYETLDSVGVFERGPAVQANATGIATIVFDARGNYSKAGWWQLTVSVVGKPDRAMLWFRVRPDPAKAANDARETLAKIVAVAQGIMGMIVFTAAFLIGRDVLQWTAGYWKRHKPVNAIKWIRTTFGRLGDLFADEYNTMHTQALADNPVLFRSSEYRRLIGRWKDDQYEVRQLVSRIAFLLKRSEADRTEAEKHKEEGLRLKADSKHFTDWSEVEDAYTMEELKALVPEAVYEKAMAQHDRDYRPDAPDGGLSRRKVGRMLRGGT